MCLDICYIYKQIIPKNIIPDNYHLKWSNSEVFWLMILACSKKKEGGLVMSLPEQ
jgi:hypothetical protein